MGITQTCNVACKFCYYVVPENRTKHILPKEPLIRFLSDAAKIGVKAIGFLGDGEPTLHKGVYDAVEAGASYGLDMAIATNGVALELARLPKFLESLSCWRTYCLQKSDGRKRENLPQGNRKHPQVCRNKARE